MVMQIAVNQQWAGHPGYLVASIDPSAKPNSEGFLVFARGALQAGNDLDVRNVSSLAAAETWCKGNSSCSGFTTRVIPDKTTGYKVRIVVCRCPTRCVQPTTVFDVSRLMLC